MTKLFKEAVEAISILPDEMQDELARVLLQLASIDQPLVDLTPEEEAALDESIAQAEWANSHPTRISGRSGQSTVCEDSLHRRAASISLPS